jgi:AcrR family transcriptional regulator
MLLVGNMSIRIPSERTTRWTRQAPAARRAEILRAARRVFGRSSYASVAMADVAREAGVSRALVNHYFGSKRDLFIETLRQSAAAAPAAVRTDLALPVEEMVATNTSFWLDYVEANPHMLEAIAGGGPLAGDPDAQAVVAELRDALVGRMLLNHFGGRVVDPRVRLALRAYTGLFDVAVRDWVGTGRATRAQVHEVLVQCLLAIVRDAVPRLVAADRS